MTVSTTSNRVIYRGNGAATNFAVPFKVLDADHLIVRRRVFATGVYEHTYIGTDYNYVGIGASSGTLTLSGTALSSTYELVIERIVPYTQDLDIVNAGGFYPDTVEEQLDLIVMGLQQLDDLTDRALLVPTGEDGPALPTAAGRALTLLGFDVAGDLDLLTIPEAATLFKGDPGGNVESVGVLAALQASPPTIPAATTRIRTSGYSVEDDGGGAEYVLKTTIDIYRHATRDGTTPTKLSAMRRTDDLVVGMALDGEGIPVGASLSAVDSAIKITISAASTYSPTTIIRFRDRAINAAYQTLYPQRVFQDASGAWWHLSRNQVLAPEMFGAVGDGVTDCYAAFVAMAEFINSAGGGAIRCNPRKVYYIGQNRTAANGVDCIRFNGLDGFLLDLNGSKIDFKGDFDRDVSTTTGIGIRIDSSRRIIVRNGELDGNIEETTNTSGANESNRMTGLRFGGCEDFIVENVLSHYFGQDAFGVEHDADTYEYLTVLGSDYNRRASKRGYFLNCQGLFSGRIAFLTNSAEMIIAENCDFSETCQFGGTYGVGGAPGHGPKTGFDFEPTENKSVEDSLDVDPNNIHFVGCRFANNLGGNWRAGKEDTTHTLTFTRCRLESAANSPVTDDTILGIPGVVIRDCYIDMKAVRFHLNGGLGKATHLLVDNEIRGSMTTPVALHLNGVSASTVIRHNRFIGTATAAAAARLIDTANNPTTAVFEDNTVFIPAASFTDEGSGADSVVSLANIRRAARNRYMTDLAHASNHFHVTYGTTEAIDEEFVGTAPGVTDTFRPGTVSTFDTRNRYSRNRRGYLGVPGKQALADADFSYQNDRDANHLELAVPITADRAVALTTTNTAEGAEVTVVRTAAATGAFNLNVGTGPLKALAAAGEWGRFRYSGGAWTQIGFGSL